MTVSKSKSYFDLAVYTDVLRRRQPGKVPSELVDNRDNDGGRRRRPRPPYLRAALALSFANHHAILAAIPRRAAGAASGLGGRRPPRTAAQGRARMEGAVALQQGEDAVVLRQR